MKNLPNLFLMKHKQFSYLPAAHITNWDTDADLPQPRVLSYLFVFFFKALSLATMAVLISRLFFFLLLKLSVIRLTFTLTVQQIFSGLQAGQSSTEPL